MTIEPTLTMGMIAYNKHGLAKLGREKKKKKAVQIVVEAKQAQALISAVRGVRMSC
jgi:hypothetical protein